jgi:hypothetical protein
MRPRKPGRPTSIDWKRYDALLGTMYDRELAARIPCHVVTVINRRKMLRIPAFRSTLVA